MIPFIQRDGEIEEPPPYSFPGVTIRSYRLLAEWSALYALCNQQLNIDTLEKRGFVYFPLPLIPLNYVDMEILTYPKLVDDNPETPFRGFITQQECYFRFLVVKYVPFGLLLIPQEFSMFFPYIAVTESWSMVTGREVIGLPKLLVRIDIPGYPQNTVVSTETFDSYSPQAELEWRPMVTAQPAAPGAVDMTPPALPWPWGNLDLGALDPTHQALFDETFAATGFGAFSTVQLKQFRDAADAEAACYQALLRAEYGVSNIEWMGFTPPSKITIPAYASLSIAETLGLMPALGSTAADVYYEPVFEYSLKCDMTYGNVTVLHETSD
jgi:hypothetical protein